MAAAAAAYPRASSRVGKRATESWLPPRLLARGYAAAPAAALVAFVGALRLAAGGMRVGLDLGGVLVGGVPVAATELGLLWISSHICAGTRRWPR